MNPANEMASMLARLEELDQLEAFLRDELEAVHLKRAEIHFGRMHDWLDMIEAEKGEMDS